MGIFTQLKQSLFGLSPWSKAAKKNKKKKKKTVKKGPKRIIPRRNLKTKPAPRTRTKPKSKTAKTRSRKKSVKKTPIKPIPKRGISASKPAKVKLPIAQEATPPEITEIFLGEVTHYFPRVNAAAIIMEEGELKIGDKLRIRGETTNFTQTVKSLQINREPISIAKKGDEIGVEVASEVRIHDKIYRIV